MSKILSISIPDKLNERLQAHKGSLNVSALCQEALDAAIRIEEAKNMEGDEMEKLIARLKVEKEAIKQSSFGEGTRHGIEDAKNYSYVDFLAVEKIEELIAQYGYDCNVPLELLEKEIVDDDSIDAVEEKWDSIEYWRGWVTGMMDVWEKVKGQI